MSDTKNEFDLPVPFCDYPARGFPPDGSQSRQIPPLILQPLQQWLARWFRNRDLPDVHLRSRGHTRETITYPIIIVMP